MKVRETLKLIKTYQDKDYFFDNDFISNKINERDRAIESGQEHARLYTDKMISKYIKKDTRNRVFHFTACKIYNAIQNKDKKYLKSVVRYDQKLSKELFTLYTGIKLPNTNKGINEVISKEI